MHEAFQEHPEIARRFEEIHPPFEKQAAVVEANRCLNCFDAPCTGACPTHIDVPRFIKKIATANLRGSAMTILSANILGASCARVCPVDVLCEGACVMHRYNKQPIEIGRLQRYAMDAFYSSGAKLELTRGLQRSERVACIGAGPASLACAAELRQRGFEVTVFDKRPLPGGLNTYGVAEYKLRSADSLREVELVRSLGVEFRFESEISDEAALQALEEEFNAVFIGIGLGAMHRLGIPGAELNGVVDALEFIAGYKTGGRVDAGRSVVVIGAGNTAIDAACAAKRLGAEKVYVAYRRTVEDISAFEFEYEHALHEGVEFVWKARPVAIHPSDLNAGIRAMEFAMVEPREDGSLQVVDGGNFQVLCDMVIPAIGQSPLIEFLNKCRDIQTDHGRVVIERATGQTTNPKYFAGGDCVNGGREVVDAVADGKRAAIGIASVLEKRLEAVHA